MADSPANGTGRKLVQGRLTKDLYWEMKKAMLHDQILTNDRFVVEAIEMKIASILAPPRRRVRP